MANHVLIVVKLYSGMMKLEKGLYSENKVTGANQLNCSGKCIEEGVTEYMLQTGGNKVIFPT